MKFAILLEELLTELSPSEIYDKYYSDIPLERWYQIVAADPKTKLKKGVDFAYGKIGKYSKILLKLYKEGYLKPEDLPKAKEYLDYVYKHNVPLNAKDIKSLGDIYSLIEKYVAIDTTDFSKIMGTLKEGEDYDLLLDGENWFILTPHNERAACRLGVGTQWCTTWGPYSLNPNYKDRTNHFQSYNISEQLYIIVNKKDTTEKYQFHFSSEQFMNIKDVQINIQDFFRHRLEVKYFFFPSLQKENEVPNEWEISNFYVLPDDEAAEIVRKYGHEKENTLVNAIINRDEEVIDRLTHHIDDEMYGDIIEIGLSDYSFSLLISMNKIPREVQGVSDRLGWLESDLHGSTERLYEQARNDIEYGHYFQDQMKEFFREYYNRNTDFINYNLRSRSFEEFEKRYFDEFNSSDEIIDEIINEIVNKSEGDYLTAYQNEIDGIKKYIEIDKDYSRFNLITLKGSYLLKFLIDREIDEINSMGSFLEGYLRAYDIPEELYNYDQPEYYLTYPVYSDIENAVNNFFNEMGDSFDDEYQQKCDQYKKRFRDIYQTLFKNNDTLENEHYWLHIPKPVVDCDDGTIYVMFKNKDTNMMHRGQVKIDSLGTYAHNYKLFENYIKFKKIIK